MPGAIKLKIDDTYIEVLSKIGNNEVRKDTSDMIKFIMVKRAIMKLIELAIISISALGIIPSFLG